MEEERVRQLETQVNCLMRMLHEQEYAKEQQKPYLQRKNVADFTAWRDEHLRKLAYYEARDRFEAEARKKENWLMAHTDPFCLTFEQWEEYSREKREYEAMPLEKGQKRRPPFLKMCMWLTKKEVEEPPSKRQRQLDSLF